MTLKNNNPTEAQLLAECEEIIVKNVISYDLSYRFMASVVADGNIDMFQKIVTELKARTVSGNHLFVAYTYANSEKLKYVFDFLDYLLANSRDALEEMIVSNDTDADLVIKQASTTFRNLQAANHTE